MDPEKATALLRKARMETQNPTLSEIFKMLTELVHEVSIARSEIALLTIRVEELEPRQ